MKTLPREPWRGGQICGWQIGYGLPWSIFCGELKEFGSPWCTEHDAEERFDNYGVLPKVAEGNALGVELHIREKSFRLRQNGVESNWPIDMLELSRRTFGFTLSWEPYEGDTPIPATEEEIAAWEESAA